MSGYDRDSGIFELTGTKAHYWLRRSDYPPACSGKEGMDFYAELLRHHGYEITKQATNYLHVRATPGQVWEALSGEPSDPEHEKYYLQRSVRNVPIAPKKVKAENDGVNLLPPEALELFRSGVDGWNRPLTMETASGRSSCRICGKPIEKGTLCFQGGWDFSNGRNGPRPTKCYLHLTCLGR